MLKKLKPYIISVAISLGVGGLASLLTMGNMDIYTTLNTPPLSPPGWLFPVVWTVLYTLMGISAAIIYTSNDVDSKSALTVYAAQLIVNFFWSLIFFNMRAFLFAFVWILLLDLLVIIMIMKFYRISPISAYLQLPYLVWILFASYLNLGIFLLNR